MRISDWSSDVCSSDLNPLVARRGDIAKPPPHSYSLEMLWIRTAALALVILVAIAGGWSMADAAAQNRHVTGSCHEEAARHSTDDRAVQAGHVCIRSEEQPTEIQTLMRTSYAVCRLKKKTQLH